MTTLQRATPRYLCESCSKRCHQWENTCPHCGAAALVPIVKLIRKAKLISVKASELDDIEEHHVPTGRPAWDEVLEGGLVCPSSVLVFGRAGIGKTTLCLGIASRVAEALGGSVLIGSAEMPADKVRRAAKRAGVDLSRLFIAETDDVDAFAREIKAHRPRVTIWDSIQAFETNGVVDEYLTAKRAIDAGPGAVRILISQISKTGDYHGDNRIRHGADATIGLELDRKGRWVVLEKHRFGPAPRRALDVDPV